ncbi:histone deacetylase RPD3 [Daedaleopsis nitida]|nr:histone deacetylase RPD3 [Daedaleopsis nitida]
MSKRRVSYYYDPDVGAYTYGLAHPMKPQRMRITHELVSAYDMLPKMQVLRAKRATAESMTKFHTDEYVDFLSKVTYSNVEKLTCKGTRFLVGEDNPAFDGVFEFCSISAGGSVAAAHRLMNGEADIAINWAGGLHHAKKREASGFCYINDIVLAILEMLRSVPRVLYIDIDCHHGDGVEEAFYTTDRVMTCSFHKFGEYFPGTGTLFDRGRGKGRGYAVNVPLKDGVTDESFKVLFEPIIDKIIEVYQPSAIVLQCGADSLSGDKLGCLNLTMKGHASCVQYVRKKNIPLLLLGGGGYTVKNVARAWTYETACALGIENDIDLNLPWNEYFEWFGPRYRLEVLESNIDDLNVGGLQTLRDTVLQHLSELRPAPSVGLQDVPGESVGEHLGIGRAYEQAPLDDLDRELAQHTRFVYNLQESQAGPGSPSSSDDESDSSAVRTRSRSRRAGSRVTRNGKKRMSLLTGGYYDESRLEERENGYYDLGCGDEPWAAASSDRGVRRHFFGGAARWDTVLRQIVLERERSGAPDVSVDVGKLMAVGGRAEGEPSSSDAVEDEMDVDDKPDA